MDTVQFSRAVFKDRHVYKTLDDSEKEKAFFMFNRAYLRGVPILSDALNRKGIDTLLAMDVLFEYNKKHTNTPPWFSINWSKMKSIKSDSVLKKYSSIDRFLLSFYKDVIEQEKERIKSEKDFEPVEVLKNKGRKKKS